MNQSRAISIISWGATPIKLQADTGLLVAFMLLWNMLRARVLPALAHTLLKPSALQRSADAKASVQLAGETA